ncbi:MAG: hypothetical protein JOS17DRAFT_778288 [Linnemannia elongata]|nr:MAG: hypothetical protein JOS17DRAFT_778288 [Linnemannia elongata]
MPYDLDEHNWLLTVPEARGVLTLSDARYLVQALETRAFTITLKMSLDWAHQVFQQSDPQFFRFLEKFIRNKPCLPVAPLSPSFSITLDLTICDLFSLFREEQIVISFGDPLGDPAPALQIQEVINWLDPSPKELANWRRAMASISVFPIPQRNSPGSREVGALMAIEMSCNPYVTWESYESPLYHRIRFLKVLTTYTEIREDPICKAYFQKKPYVEHPSQIEEMKNYLHSMLRFNGDNATQKCPMPVYIQEKTEVILIEDSESDNDEPPGETGWSEDMYDEGKDYVTADEIGVWLNNNTVSKLIDISPLKYQKPLSVLLHFPLYSSKRQRHLFWHPRSLQFTPTPLSILPAPLNISFVPVLLRRPDFQMVSRMTTSVNPIPS